MGSRMAQANIARQNASTNPGQPSNHGALAKNPLVLHNTAASMIIQRELITILRWLESPAGSAGCTTLESMEDCKSGFSQFKA